MNSTLQLKPLTGLLKRAALGLVFAGLSAHAAAQSIVMSSTTSTEQSGLFGHLLPDFKKATGISFHDCPEQLAWEYMTKHLQSIKDMIHHVSIDGYNGYPEKDMLREKFGDAINYLLLIELMMVERIRNFKP